MTMDHRLRTLHYTRELLNNCRSVLKRLTGLRSFIGQAGCVCQFNNSS